MTISTPEEIEPFCHKNARALIERAWPAAKISAETQKERKGRFRTDTDRIRFLLERAQAADSDPCLYFGNLDACYG